jgi:hypothetical protein
MLGVKTTTVWGADFDGNNSLTSPPFTAKNMDQFRDEASSIKDGDKRNGKRRPRILQTAAFVTL